MLVAFPRRARWCRRGSGPLGSAWVAILPANWRGPSSGAFGACGTWAGQCCWAWGGGVCLWLWPLRMGAGPERRWAGGDPCSGGHPVPCSSSRAVARGWGALSPVTSPPAWPLDLPPAAVGGMAPARGIWKIQLVGDCGSPRIPWPRISRWRKRLGFPTSVLVVLAVASPLTLLALVVGGGRAGRRGDRPAGHRLSGGAGGPRRLQGGRAGRLGGSLAGLFVLLAGSMAAILLLAGSGRHFGPLPAGLAVLLLGLGLAAFVLTSLAHAAISPPRTDAPVGGGTHNHPRRRVGERARGGRRRRAPRAPRSCAA